MWKQFQEADAAYIMKQLFGAMTYCHQNNLIHRNLKLEKILVDSIEESKRNIKIIGFANAISSSKKKLTELVGTPNYIAPEAIDGMYGPKGDVWSLGVIMYLMLSGEYPINGVDADDVLNNIKTGVYNFDGI